MYEKTDIERHTNKHITNKQKATKNVRKKVIERHSNKHRTNSKENYQKCKKDRHRPKKKEAQRNRKKGGKKRKGKTSEWFWQVCVAICTHAL